MAGSVDCEIGSVIDAVAAGSEPTEGSDSTGNVIVSSSKLTLLGTGRGTTLRLTSLGSGSDTGGTLLKVTAVGTGSGTASVAEPAMVSH